MSNQTSAANYAERTYAGVLGKIIGVYLGRPVEGWPFAAIEERFGAVDYYVHREVGAPLIVADDDISGTFGFFRAVEESGYANPLTPAHVGAAWLNAIVPEKTILWWGGLGRSTEHTAWLRLKSGIPAPQSGSMALNGRTMAEQIGAQIFIDAFAMTCPGDPARAAAMARAAASVSHDGLAVDAAGFLAALEALAYDVHDLEPLIAQALPFAREPRLLHLIDDVRNICQGESDWRRARARLDERHGYHCYAGPCPMATNHAAVLMALLLGGDNFQRSVMIAASAGWDTDCNAGSVGCLNAIRLGLDAIDAGANLRAAVADRMYVVTADGGGCVTDAVIQTRRILAASAAYRGEALPSAQPRFGFEFRGARQGFVLCPAVPQPEPVLRLSNLNQAPGAGVNGLVLDYGGLAHGVHAAVSTPVFLDFAELVQNFSTVGSPSLYPTQTVVAHVQTFAAENPSLRFYVLYYDRDDQLLRCDGPTFTLHEGCNELRWQLPPLDGMPILRFGIELLPDQARYGRRYDGRLVLLDLDWAGAPVAFVQSGMLMRSIWNLAPHWLRAWVSSARHFAPDFTYTYCVSQPEEGGIVTLGTTDWCDYRVSSRLYFSLHKAGGLVLRSQGHRRYYAAQFSGGDTVAIVRCLDGQTTVLAQASFAYAEEQLYALSFAAQGRQLRLELDGVPLLATEDPDGALACGGAGFVVDTGTMLVDGFAVHHMPEAGEAL